MSTTKNFTMGIMDGSILSDTPPPGNPGEFGKKSVPRGGAFGKKTVLGGGDFGKYLGNFRNLQKAKILQGV